MTGERWKELMRHPNSGVELTPQEIADGWHFCWDWDGLLIGPGDEEMACCHCSDDMNKSR